MEKYTGVRTYIAPASTDFSRALETDHLPERPRSTFDAELSRTIYSPGKMQEDSAIDTSHIDANLSEALEIPTLVNAIDLETGTEREISVKRSPLLIEPNDPDAYDIQSIILG